MPRPRADFQNFQVDHMTVLTDPKMYNVTYLIFRNIFGATPEDIIYNVKKEWKPGQGEQSLTFATRLGQGSHPKEEFNSTMLALVQPTEPESEFSHVRKMLQDHQAAFHLQHIALRTPDLLSFHKHCLERGVRFVTPILKDGQEDLIQVFSGEWFYPGSIASAFFFEFVQREPSKELVQMLEERNRETFFRDKTFLGLYGEKQKEYESGKVTPFVDPALFNQLYDLVGNKKFWEISEKDIDIADEMMLEYAKKNQA